MTAAEQITIVLSGLTLVAASVWNAAETRGNTRVLKALMERTDRDVQDLQRDGKFYARRISRLEGIIRKYLRRTS